MPNRQKRKLFAGTYRSIERVVAHRRPHFEHLEDRMMLANYVLLDFTPDAIDDEITVGKFANTFNGAVNATNRFLDYDSNNLLNSADAGIAAKQISSKVRKLLKPFIDKPSLDLHVLFTPNVTNSLDPGVGETRLAAGQASDEDNIYVMYVGDLAPSADLPDFGMSFQAFQNENNETYGYVFAKSSADYLKSGEYKWKATNKLATTDYTNFVAYAIAHELGHLWGLGHLDDRCDYPESYAENYSHVMNYPKHADPGSARFLDDDAYWMEVQSRGGAAEHLHINAKQEVEQSLGTNAGANFSNLLCRTQIMSCRPMYGSWRIRSIRVGRIRRRAPISIRDRRRKACSATSLSGSRSEWRNDSTVAPSTIRALSKRRGNRERGPC